MGILHGLDDHMGLIFEEMAREHARGLAARGELKADQVDSWWSSNGAHGIDIVGVSGAGPRQDDAGYTWGMVRPTVPPPGFEELSADEKLEYIQTLWDHFSQHPEDVPVPDWHQKVVAERLAAYRRGEIDSRPWPEIRNELLDQLRSVR